MGGPGSDYRRSTMVDETDVEKVLGWLRANCRQQPWRALDKRGRPRTYQACVCELSRNKMRLILNMPHARLDAAIREIFESGAAVPLGRMLPIESQQAVELWMVNR